MSFYKSVTTGLNLGLEIGWGFFSFVQVREF